MATSRKTFDTLNAMRGLAAIAVVLFHAARVAGFAAAPLGYLAVDLFFVLSGFVIAHAYGNSLDSTVTVERFIWIRIARFWPLLALGVLIGAARSTIGILLQSDTALSPLQLGVAMITSLFLVPAPVTASGDLFILNVPLWTLSLELAVNIGYGRFHRRLSPRWLVLAAIAGGAVMIAFALDAGSNNIGATAATVLGGLGRAVCGFSIGLLLYRYRGRRVTVPALMVLAALAVLLFLPLHGEGHVLYDLTFALVLAPALVLLGAASELPRPWLPFARYLGTISFPIYAIHSPLLGVAEAISTRLGLPAAALAGLVIVGLLIVCPFVYRYYDQPLYRWLQRLPAPWGNGRLSSPHSPDSRS
jgi:peptidoglycan/LPS O-acetylase OafA/YrhL